MAKEPKAHQLSKQIDFCALVVTNPSAGTGTVTNQWELIQLDANTAMIACRTYIDLAGWSMQELTTFTQGIDIQKQQIPLKVPTGLPKAQSVWEFDFITSRRLTTNELTDITSLPGFSGSTCSLQQVIYGERMMYGENATIPGNYIQISSDTFGSGNPTAMDKLHWTRLLIIDSPGDGEQLAVFPTNLVVQAMTVEEKDLVWMERLRRSFVTQGRNI